MGVLADSINSSILCPNYPFLVLSGSHPDSFPSTAPFGFAAAQYFIPMTSLLGTAIAATFMGTLSDKIGRKPVLLVCVGMGAVGSIAKYLARGSFAGFCIANFVTGLFGATASVAMAYAGDVAHTRAEKDRAIGSLIGFLLTGATGGGLIAIVIQESGLFTPLFVSATLNVLATVIAYVFMVEPKRLLAMKAAKVNGNDNTTEEEGTGTAPSTLDWKVTTNIILGSLADNAGSVGLVPFCLAPLAFNAFLGDFVARNEAPIVSESTYKWLSTLLATMVIPSAMFSNKLFAIIGAAGNCVLGNFLTAVVTIVILQLVLINPPSSVSFGLFTAFLYTGFPLTVISQLTTGPMLDRVSPADRRGMTQGPNSMAMNLGSVIFPFLFGTMADVIGTNSTIWVCVGISFLAAILNAPLIFVPSLRRPKRPVPDYSRHVKGEDEDVVQSLLSGEWVHPELLHNINMDRMQTGRHFLRIPIRPYNEDKGNLCSLKRHAKEDFRFYKSTMAGFLASCDLDSEEKRQSIANAINVSHLEKEQIEEQANALGKWFVRPRGAESDDDKVAPEHIEEFAVNMTKVFNHYLEEEEAPSYLQALAGY